MQCPMLKHIRAKHGKHRNFNKMPLPSEEISGFSSVSSSLERWGEDAELLTYDTASLYTFYKISLKQQINDNNR